MYKEKQIFIDENLNKLKEKYEDIVNVGYIESVMTDNDGIPEYQAALYISEKEKTLYEAQYFVLIDELRIFSYKYRREREDIVFNFDTEDIDYLDENIGERISINDYGENYYYDSIDPIIYRVKDNGKILEYAMYW